MFYNFLIYLLQSYVEKSLRHFYIVFYLVRFIWITDFNCFGEKIFHGAKSFWSFGITKHRKIFTEDLNKKIILDEFTKKTRKLKF